MATKKIDVVIDNKIFCLTKETITYSDGEQAVSFRLYDYAAGYNLSTGSVSEHEAFAEAVAYWQVRALEAETTRRSLETKVNAFLVMFHPEYDVHGNYPDDAVDFANSYM